MRYIPWDKSTATTMDVDFEDAFDYHPDIILYDRTMICSDSALEAMLEMAFGSKSRAQQIMSLVNAGHTIDEALILFRALFRVDW